MDPVSTLRAAFSAVAQGQAHQLVSLLEPESLARWRTNQLRLIGPATRGETGSTPSILEHAMRRFDCTSFDELQSLSAPEMVARSLRSLPAIRSSIEVNVDEVRSVDANTVVVKFRPLWEGVSLSDEVPESSAVLRRTNDDEWRLVAAASSAWVIPGFENVLFGE